MTHGDVKRMIETAASVEEADDVIRKHTYCKTYGDKIVYLRQLFYLKDDLAVRSHKSVPLGGVTDNRVRYLSLLGKIVKG